MTIIQRIRDHFCRERQLRALVDDLKREREQTYATFLTLPQGCDVRMVRDEGAAEWRAVVCFRYGYFTGYGALPWDALNAALDAWQQSIFFRTRAGKAAQT